MSDLQHTAFVFVNGIAVFHPDGRQTTQQAVQLVREAIVCACARRIHKLLVVIIDIAGLEVPGLAMRFSMVREWAAAAGNVVSVAVVYRPELIDPQKIGVTLATSCGMVADVFDSEDDGMRWLRELE